MKLLAVTGSVLILFSIATGWVIIARRYLSLEIAKRYIRDDEKLVKGHMDYIIMGMILLIFYVVEVNLPSYVILLACAGAFANPSLFIFLSLKPDVNKKIGSVFSVISTMSFFMTTAGIGGAAFFLFLELIQ